MSVPLHKLYNFLDDVINEDIVIYRWEVNGSKKLEDLKILKLHSDYYRWTSPSVVCHDQEPLNYSQYSRNEIVTALVNRKKPVLSSFSKEQITVIVEESGEHLNYFQELCQPFNIYDRYILMHSEKNSDQLNIYKQYDAIPVYYFSHALIARDWYRYAQVDPTLSKKSITQDFLVYQRSWSGTREYRLKFLELLIQNNLVKHCLTKFNPYDEHQTHYSQHCYQNNKFKVNLDLENFVKYNNISSEASADYCANDYTQTWIEVVLETIFDDTRWHLTEKIFRPIACGQPFILAATPGSLKYLQSYGFKTFGDYIDESYDNIECPIARLNKIIDLLKTLSNLSDDEKIDLYTKMQINANYNRQLFFSDVFFNNIVDEYITNMSYALTEIKKSKGKNIKSGYDLLKKHNINFISDEDYTKILSLID